MLLGPAGTYFCILKLADPRHEIAARQMGGFGGVLSFSDGALLRDAALRTVAKVKRE